MTGMGRTVLWEARKWRNDPLEKMLGCEGVGEMSR